MKLACLQQRSSIRHYWISILHLAGVTKYKTSRISAPLVFAVVVSMLSPLLVYASGTATGGPGASSIWSPATNSILGTAANTTSDVWFTGYKGIISEVYYPTDDIANTTDLQFMVGDSAHSWVDEEKAATTSTASLYDPHSLAWTVTNTATSGKYSITKTIYTDPTRNSLIQQVTFTALTGTLSNYLLYVLYNPTIHNAGNSNSSSTQTYNGTTMLISTDSTGNYASALAASLPYTSGMTSSGFVGVNDGWTDLKGTSNCGSSTCPDYTMNDTYSAANSGNTAQTGELDLTNGGAVNTSTATSITFNLVLSFGQTNGSTSATTGAEQTLAGTLGDTSNMLSTYVSQWNTFDNSLNTPPAVGSTTTIQQARQKEYYLAANVLKASQDKQTGAFVAGLGTPWGDTTGDGNSGYHLVWERDMYEFASALIVAGDTADPTRAVEWAFDTQQESDGHFPQNSYVSGTPYWTGIQMDEQAFPIILAWKLGLTDSTDYAHVKAAANYIVQHGPTTGQDRWEENGGYSPSTIAAEIAGLVCAADLAKDNGDTTDEALYNSTADYWQGMVQNWTFTTTGSLSSAGYYFERIDNNGNPNDGSTISIANGGGSYDERSVVDAGFLELVRLGIFPANSPYITLSLPVIDSTIEETINGNSYWFRYNHDGYGETSSGANYTGAGVGRLWPILSGERGVYTIANGGSGDAALTAMMSAANASGFIPEQVWDTSPPSGDTAGTPTSSMDPLNWAMGEYITLLFSTANSDIADMPSIVYNRYVTNAYVPSAAKTIDYNSSQLEPGDALTIYYHGTLDSQSKLYLHWGENSWNNVSDATMVKRADGIWQTTISVPTDATTLNMAFDNGSGTWDSNSGSNYNLTIGSSTTTASAVASSPTPPIPGQSVTITYDGTLASSATSVTMHWGYNSWNSITDTTMTKQSNGTWQATVTVPTGATVLNMAYYNQSGTWDNNSTNNYNLTTSVVASSSALVAGSSATIIYDGTLASSATSVTMHWGYNSWTGTTNTTMTKQSNGTWTATITVPSGATTLNTAFYNQSSTWDNNSGNNYNLSVS